MAPSTWPHRVAPTCASLDLGDRPTRSQKRQEQQDRRDAKAAARAELESERKAGIWTELNNRHEVKAQVIEAELAAEGGSADAGTAKD